MEEIDILLATYNGEKYLKQQLDSILNQTYSKFRLLISDDCSTDSTKQILEEYKQKDSRISVFYQEKNLGYIKNFEFLLKKVENPVYALSDQDDVWDKEKLEKYIEKMQQDNSDMVFGDLEIVDENLNVINKSFNNYMKLTKKITKAKGYKKMYLHNCVTGCTIVAKNKFMDKILPLPNETKHLLHDHWISLIIAIYGKVSYIDAPYIKYRQHGENQIGTEKTSAKMKKLDEIRQLFINVKLEMFTAYVKNNDKFPEELQKLNIKALKYFEKVNKKQKFNFKNWGLYFKLYKNETVSYFILNFIIINLPSIGRILFKIKNKRSK